MSSTAFSGAGGTLAVFLPTKDGLVVAADKRQTPRGIFCDGINKILVPTGLRRTVVVVTGFISMQDTSNIPDAELCKHLAETPAPLDFGRTTLSFLEAHRVALKQFDGQAFTNRIHADIAPYIQAGNLNPFFGSRLAQIIIADFEPDMKSSMILALGVDLNRDGAFTLQPIPISPRTTIHGTIFKPNDDRQAIPFGEGAYYGQNVIAGVGVRFLNQTYRIFLQKEKISVIDSELGTSVAANLIDAASRATEIVPAPSGIGGGISVALIADDVQFLK
ncbi:hypothetical protein [Bradyrhizobium sp. CB3481]|uniref:hypothetical protein n=1 Tax=Bradyrhizobium sp. CB3481 TaxID=3039158 RepID=UPI0024B13D37|nr:hypothetical protein [Bradyrhizobium sp. CB3481]WFU15990.1 hypothetical protein QA643_34370 [Bradyrhizobium sp. CB3481]